MIYTKKGDRGKTSLIGRKRVLKSDKIVWAIGEIDELNSWMGLIRSQSKNQDLDKKIRKIQSDLFLIGSILAGSKNNLDLTRVREMEKEIDELESILPVQTKFVYPTGSKISSMLFVARSITRRAERRISDLSNSKLKNILVYINRLSDYLFILARNENFRLRFKEDFWEGKR
jgi:cob(I)alamin adenosyltransferase